MPSAIKLILRRHFPWAYEALMRRYAKRIPRSEVFSSIYRDNGWKDPESRSGPGSRMEETRVVRSVLPDLLRELEVNTFLDAPCGDLNWMRHIELGAIDYIGADIVPQLIADNTARFSGVTEPGGTRYKFQLLDIVAQPIPRADLILCRDCLVHLSLRDAASALRNFMASGSRYLLATTFISQATNTDIIIGWHPINLQLPPFSLPAPLRLIDEGSTESAQSDKRLGLWDLHAIR